MTGTGHKGPPVTWAKIMRSIGKGTELIVVGTPGIWAAPLDALLIVQRVTTKGMYVTHQHSDGTQNNAYIAWPPASFVVPLDATTWILHSGSEKQAWKIVK